jgi:hypothetical protein
MSSAWHDKAVLRFGKPRLRLSLDIAQNGHHRHTASHVSKSDTLGLRSKIDGDLIAEVIRVL